MEQLFQLVKFMYCILVIVTNDDLYGDILLIVT